MPKTISFLRYEFKLTEIRVDGHSQDFHFFDTTVYNLFSANVVSVFKRASRKDPPSCDLRKLVSCI